MLTNGQSLSPRSHWYRTARRLWLTSIHSFGCKPSQANTAAAIVICSTVVICLYMLAGATTPDLLHSNASGDIARANIGLQLHTTNAFINRDGDGESQDDLIQTKTTTIQPEDAMSSRPPSEDAHKIESPKADIEHSPAEAAPRDLSESADAKPSHPTPRTIDTATPVASQPDPSLRSEPVSAASIAVVLMCSRIENFEKSFRSICSQRHSFSDFQIVVVNLFCPASDFRRVALTLRQECPLPLVDPILDNEGAPLESVAAARNAGIARSQSSWVQVVDDAVTFDLGFLQSASQQLAARRESFLNSTSAFIVSDVKLNCGDHHHDQSSSANPGSINSHTAHQDIVSISLPRLQLTMHTEGGSIAYHRVEPQIDGPALDNFLQHPFFFVRKTLSSLYEIQAEIAYVGELRKVLNSTLSDDQLETLSYCSDCGPDGPKREQVSPLSAVIFRRSVWNAVPFRSSAFFGWEDQDFWLRVASKYSIDAVRIPSPMLSVCTPLRVELTAAELQGLTGSDAESISEPDPQQEHTHESTDRAESSQGTALSEQHQKSSPPAESARTQPLQSEDAGSPTGLSGTRPVEPIQQLPPLAQFDQVHSETQNPTAAVQQAPLQQQQQQKPPQLTEESREPVPAQEIQHEQQQLAQHAAESQQEVQPQAQQREQPPQQLQQQQPSREDRKREILGIPNRKLLSIPDPLRIKFGRRVQLRPIHSRYWQPFCETDEPSTSLNRRDFCRALLQVANAQLFASTSMTQTQFILRSNYQLLHDMFATNADSLRRAASLSKSSHDSAPDIALILFQTLFDELYLPADGSEARCQAYKNAYLACAQPSSAGIAGCWKQVSLFHFSCLTSAAALKKDFALSDPNSAMEGVRRAIHEMLSDGTIPEGYRVDALDGVELLKDPDVRSFVAPLRLACKTFAYWRDCKARSVATTQDASQQCAVFHNIVSRSSIEFYSVAFRSIASVFRVYPRALVITHFNDTDSRVETRHRQALALFQLEGFQHEYAPISPKALESLSGIPDISGQNSITSHLLPFEQTRYFSYHYADLYRYLIQYNYGGTYIDTDMVIFRPLHRIRNAVGLQVRTSQDASELTESQALSILKAFPFSLSGAVMNFDQRSNFIRHCLLRIRSSYDAEVWESLGPKLLQIVAATFLEMAAIDNQPTARSVTSILSLPSRTRGWKLPSLRILPSAAFFKYGSGGPESLEEMYLKSMDESQWEAVQNDRSIIGIHLWNKSLSLPQIQQPHSFSVGMRALNVACRRSLAQPGKAFSATAAQVETKSATKGRLFVCPPMAGQFGRWWN